MSKNKNNTAARTVSNKTAPKPPAQKTMGTKGAVVKDKLEEVEIEDEDDEDEDEEIEVGGRVAAKGRRTQKERLVQTVTRLSKHLARMLARAEGTPELHNKTMIALAGIGSLAETVNELPADWKRTGAARAQVKSFNIGDIVKISDARRSQYEDFLDADEMDELTVVKQIGKKVSLRSASGTKFFVPGWHVAKA